jgi:hypothetical protein
MKASLRDFLATHKRTVIGPGPKGSCEIVKYEPVEPAPTASAYALSWATVLTAGAVAAIVSAVTTMVLVP